MDQGVNSDQVAYWNARAGETWVAKNAQLDRQLLPLGREVMRALAIMPGEQVLDVGCGCGQTSLGIADQVGDDGIVLGADISAPMLALARSRAQAAAVNQVQFVEADAQVYEFGAGRFDVIFSRFGVMFFADPAAAFANLRRALRPGGRLGFVCWRDVSLNLFMTLPMAAAAPLLPATAPPADPHAPGPFAFADPDRLRQLLNSAGFDAITLTPHDQAIGGGDLDETASLALTIGPLGVAMRENPHLAPKIRERVREAVAPHLTADGVLLASASWIVTAQNPH